MKLFGVNEVDGGARALHLHHPLPRPHSVEHGASVCGALTTDCASKLVVVLASRGRSSGSGSGRVGAGLGRSAAAARWWQLNTRHRGRSVLAPAPLLPLPESKKILLCHTINQLKARGTCLFRGMILSGKDIANVHQANTMQCHRQNSFLQL